MMNETKAAKGKKEKVGPDGLSKKERRALKVAEKTQKGNQEKNNEANDTNKEVASENNTNFTEVRKVEGRQRKKSGGTESNFTEVRKVEGRQRKKSGGTEKKKNEESDGEKTNEVEVKNKSGDVIDTGELKTLSKKERKALKIGEKSKGDTESKPIVTKTNAQNIPLDIKTIQKKNVEADKRDKAESNDVKENIHPKAGVEIEGKSKAQLRAERRELQEKQRLSKLAAKEIKTEENDPSKKSPLQRKSTPRKIYIRKVVSGQVQLFNHLHFTPLTAKEKSMVMDVHPSFIRLGAQYASKTILGSNARCLALLSALKDLIDDFVTPPKQDLCRSLETCLQTSVAYLQKCRPFAVSMTNALRHFKVHCTQVKTDISDAEKKSCLQNIVAVYVEDEILTAGKAISMKVSEKITDGDVILIYGCSSLVLKILTDARKEGKYFKVIVVDSRPLFEGREMLRKLVNADINCSYALVNASSYIMSHATKVLLGAHSLLANGYVMARTGTAQVALVARAYNKPVLVCCETYKFCERVQTDSIVYNEIADPDRILESSDSHDVLKKKNALTPLNLMYDVTPPDLVTAVVTELGFLPCTSVPVVLRIKPTE